MLVVCSKCKTRLRVSEEKIKPSGAKFKCAKCGAILSIKNLVTPTINNTHNTNTPANIQVEKKAEASHKEPNLHSHSQGEVKNEDSEDPSLPVVRSYWTESLAKREEDKDNRSFI